jgi:hypothetical protein
MTGFDVHGYTLAEFGTPWQPIRNTSLIVTATEDKAVRNYSWSGERAHSDPGHR